MADCLKSKSMTDNLWDLYDNYLLRILLVFIALRADHNDFKFPLKNKVLITLFPVIVWRSACKALEGAWKALAHVERRLWLLHLKSSLIFQTTNGRLTFIRHTGGSGVGTRSHRVIFPIFAQFVRSMFYERTQVQSVEKKKKF